MCQKSYHRDRDEEDLHGRKFAIWIQELKGYPFSDFLTEGLDGGLGQRWSKRRSEKKKKEVAEKLPGRRGRVGGGFEVESRKKKKKGGGARKVTTGI